MLKQFQTGAQKSTKQILVTTVESLTKKWAGKTLLEIGNDLKAVDVKLGKRETKNGNTSIMLILVANNGDNYIFNLSSPIRKRLNEGDQLDENEILNLTGRKNQTYLRDEDTGEIIPDADGKPQFRTDGEIFTLGAPSLLTFETEESVFASEEAAIA